MEKDKFIALATEEGLDSKEANALWDLGTETNQLRFLDEATDMELRQWLRETVETKETFNEIEKARRNPKVRKFIEQQVRAAQKEFENAWTNAEIMAFLLKHFVVTFALTCSELKHRKVHHLLNDMCDMIKDDVMKTHRDVQVLEALRRVLNNEP